MELGDFIFLLVRFFGIREERWQFYIGTFSMCIFRFDAKKCQCLPAECTKKSKTGEG